MGFRKGDRVSIMGTLDYNQEGERSLFISLDGWTGSVIIDQSKVTMVEPMLAKGEVVTVENGGAWTVIAVNDGSVWAERNGTSQIFDIGDVVRAD